ncbi:MAG: hypothetical protein MAG715_01126 [Methanonatronarchaeales archaeon]|nr:hypothetical protein [Methanonatronarchaeales archaeon]
MQIKLLYHDTNSPVGVSPFDEKLRKIVDGEDIKIACPYISMDYLEDLLEETDSWRIITDLEEWLSSHNSESRSDIRDFIGSNDGKIRHYRDIHAKVIIAGDSAIVGSANLTKKGIIGRVEMSVLVGGSPQVGELHEWFDGLWRGTSPIGLKEVDSYLETAPERTHSSHSNRITSTGPGYVQSC